MRLRRSGNRHRSRGQALIESAIVIPLMLGVFLCLLQFLLLAHAKVMLEYAAFNAARAGIVHNGRSAPMRFAATLSMLPVWGEKPTRQWLQQLLLGQGGGGVVDFGEAQVENFLSNSLATSFTQFAPRVALVEVSPINPSTADFPPGGEIDFDQPGETQTGLDVSGFTHGQPDAKQALRTTRLKISVSAIVPLAVPVGGRLVFNLWMISRYLTLAALPSDFRNWVAAKNSRGETLDDLVQRAPYSPTVATLAAAGSVRAVARDWLTFTTLKAVASATHHYYFPLETTYSMAMESNLFQHEFSP